jgi:hypothetical protein
MRASTLNFFNPPDTKLRKLKVEGVISAREMNKNYNEAWAGKNKNRLNRSVRS